MLKLRERFIVDSTGQPVEVVLPIADYRALLTRLKELDVAGGELPALDEWRVKLRQALQDAGLTTRDEVVELTREVKREQLHEHLNR
jgi:hypothetical protein